MLLSWIVSLAAYISFRRCLTAADAASLPVRSPLGPWGSVIGLVVVLAAIAKTWWDSEVNLISGVALLVGLTVAYATIKYSRRS